MASLIKNVAVIGASGNVGKSTVRALLEEGFNVTGVTRQSSNSILPLGVHHVKSDYTEDSLIKVLQGQDAVISTFSSIAPGGTLAIQKSIIDAAINAGVKVFFPSEYGIDSADGRAAEEIPFIIDKVETLNYLKTKQDKISWTALVTGSVFDWGLNIPGFGGFDVPARTATIYDGGDIIYEATNLDQVGKAIAKCLQKPELTKNQFVYVNSFSITQNQVLNILETKIGEKFKVSQGSAEGLWNSGNSMVQQGQQYGVLAMIAASFYKNTGLAQYSVTKGLWNERLSLPQENLEEFLTNYIAAKDS
jgi:nucleoside-diphosphate-sugar epimerase